MIILVLANHAQATGYNIDGLKIDVLTIFLLEAANKPIYRRTKELLPINENEFLTVSKLVRGRAKLQDVNKVCLKIDNT